MNLLISSNQWNTGVGLDWAEDSQSPRLILHRWKHNSPSASPHLFQLKITELLLLLRTIFFSWTFFLPSYYFFWWKFLCHIHYMHLNELKTTFWQRVSPVFHSFNSASELRLTGIRVPGHLPFVINFSVSNVIIPFVSILVNFYDI